MFIVGLNPLSPLIFMTGYLPRYPVVLRYVMMSVTSLNNATTAVGSTSGADTFGMVLTIPNRQFQMVAALFFMRYILRIFYFLLAAAKVI